MNPFSRKRRRTFAQTLRESSSISSVIESLQIFWRQHPALLYGLSVLFGIYAALEGNVILCMPIALLAISLLWPSIKGCLRRRFVLAAGLFLSAILLVKTTYQFPEVAPEGVMGTAYFEISSISSSSTHFGKRWLYRGTIHRFSVIQNDESSSIAKNIPCTISLAQSNEVRRPVANRAYLVGGRLKELSPGHYMLSVGKDTPWYPVSDSWSLAEYRFQAKQAVATYIRRYIKGQRTGAFLTGIATGDFDDRQMLFEFSRFGLQHIMAISGFHFAIIAGILSLFLRLAMAKRRANVLLICILSSYFIFLGCGPSVMRAWVTILIVLLGFFY